MSKQTIKNVYRQLCFLSVFCSLKEQEPFKSFFAYCESEKECEKAKHYATFVSNLYEQAQGSLTSLVERAVFENENVYIKALAAGKEISPLLQKQAQRELKSLSAFASLTCEDFAQDLGLEKEEIPAFSSVNAYLSSSDHLSPHFSQKIS